MDRYDLIAFDMDGTLLTSKKHVSENTRAAVKKAAEAGKQVALATGRCIAELKDCGDELADIRYMVCESGALIYDSWKDQILHRETLPESLVEFVLQAMTDEDVMPYYFVEGQAVTERRKLEQLEHYLMGIYRPMMERICVQVEDAAVNYRQHKPGLEKFNLFCASATIRERMREKLQNLSATFAYAETASLEISPLNVSKASGLARLSSILHIPMGHMIAVGDADNDEPMLRTAGLSVAMGNSLAHIKELCDIVVADNDHDGCAQVIEEYLLK